MPRRRCKEGSLVSPPCWISALLEDPSPDRRLEGALACYDTPNPRLLGLLIRTLRDEQDIRVKASLVKALAALKVPKSIPVLLEYLRDPDSRVRANTVEALAQYETEALRPQFERMLIDPHNRVRGNAMLALAPLGELSFRQAVEELSRSTEPSACLTALFVLSKLERRWAVSLLSRMLSRPDNPVAGQTERVLEQLERWGAPGASMALERARSSSPKANSKNETIIVLQPPKVTVRNLDRLLNAPSPQVRIFAIQEAAQRSPRDFVLPNLLKRLTIETDERVIATLTKWIGKLAAHSQLDVLEPYTAHPDGRVRANTLEGLLGVHEPRVRTLAARHGDDESPRVRAIAAQLTAGFDSEEAFDILRKLLLSDDVNIAKSALRSIENLEPVHALELLELALTRGGQEVRAKVLVILKALEPRLPLARELRYKFEAGTFAIHEGGYIREQINRLGSDDEHVRLEALSQLRYCRSSRAWEVIEELAKSDRSPRIRKMAKSFVIVYQKERLLRIHLYSLGLRIIQLYAQGGLRVVELFRLCERVSILDRAIEDDEPSTEPLERLILDRLDTLILLGERSRELSGQGLLDDAYVTTICRTIDQEN